MATQTTNYNLNKDDLTNDLVSTVFTNQNDSMDKIDTQMKVNADAIVTETSARSSADTTLQTNINNEETARIAGDDALDVRINNIIASSGTSSTEVVDARGNFATVLKNRLDAVEDTVDPTTTDDQYENGKFWINTSTDNIFVLVDNSSSNAIWKKIGDSNDILTTQGDLLTRDGSGYTRLPVGTNGQVLSTDGTDIEWIDNTNNVDVLTTQGDIIYRDASGYARLGAGTANQVLTTNGVGANPSWQDAESPVDYGRYRSILGLDDATLVSTSYDIDSRELSLDNVIDRAEITESFSAVGSQTSTRGLRFTPTQNISEITCVLADGVSSATKAYLYQGVTLLDTYNLVSGVGGEEFSFSYSFLSSTDYDVLVDDDGGTFSRSQATSVTYPKTSDFLNITAGLVNINDTTDTAAFNISSITATGKTTTGTATQTYTFTNKDIRSNNIKFELSDMVGDGTNSVDVDVYGGSSAERTADNSIFSQTTRSGIRILANKNIDGFKVTVSPTCAGFTKAYIYQGASQLTVIDNTEYEFVIKYPMLSGQNYEILIDNDASSYSRSSIGSVSYPFNSDDFNIINGCATPTVFDSNGYNVLGLQALTELASETFTTNSTEEEPKRIDISQLTSDYPSITAVITENRDNTGIASPVVSNFSFSVEGVPIDENIGLWETIQDLTLTSDVAQVDLDGNGVDLTTYEQLMILIDSDFVCGATTLGMRYNGSSSTYAWGVTVGNNGGVTNTNNTSQSQIEINNALCAGTGDIAKSTIQIGNRTSVQYGRACTADTVQSKSFVSNTVQYVQQVGGYWNGTAKIYEINLFATSGNIVAGTNFTLLGLK